LCLRGGLMSEVEELLKEVERKLKELEEELREAKVYRYLEKLRKKHEPCIVCREDRS